jgi:predicted transcriptional regulator
MSVEHFRKSVHALSGEHSVEILYFLRDRGWCIALDTAKALSIHPTTAMKYLSKMHRAGIISRRPKRSKTGSTYEYKLSSNKIVLSLDLEVEETYRANISPAITLISRIADKLAKIGSPLAPEIFKDKTEREIFALIISGKGQEATSLAEEAGDSLFVVLKKLVLFSEKSLGEGVTRDIVLSACHSLPEAVLEFMPDYVQEVVT